MSSSLYIISGPPASGKTELLRRILADSALNPRKVPKYSTRPLRKVAFDDIIHVPQIVDKKYRFTYPMHDALYGVRPEEVAPILQKGYNAFVVVSDLRVVKEIKDFFGSLAISLYIYRNISAEQFTQILQERKLEEVKEPSLLPPQDQNYLRLNRLYLMQRQYVENIALFDHVILNTTKSPHDMLRQVQNIIAAHTSGAFRKEAHGPVIFLIAGASGSGKRTLIHAMYNLGQRQIKVVRKATERLVDDTDGREIYHVNKIDSRVYDINYEFHRVRYGIKTRQIWNNLRHGWPQILITNMQQFTRFRSLFGPLVVCVYLHATRTKEQLLEWETLKHGPEKAKLRVKNMEKIHHDYINNIVDFHHVLLNTMAREDFWEQMLRLISYYKNLPY